MFAVGMYSKNFKTDCFIYTAFTSSKIARIKQMQTKPDNIEYFLKFRAHGVPRATARWEQNYIPSRKKQRT